jgi:hypothetical protein
MNYLAASYEVSTACNLCKITQQAAGNKTQLFFQVDERVVLSGSENRAPDANGSLCIKQVFCFTGL